jgi:L-alanine-DL-glutamate epimerase-like enolase superfamily enzyme
VKLKVGAYPPQRDAARLRLVRDVVGPEVAIRLDANRAWEPRDAGTALEQMAGCSPQLVEEPLRDAEPEALARLRGCGVPIALDESIATLHELERHLRAGAIDFAIVKLGRVGGPLRARALAGAAAARGLATIVTDSIETAVGQAAALHVAAGLAGPAHAVGLGGAAMLMGDDVARSLFAAPLVTLPTPGLTGAWDPRPVACRA